MHSKNFICRRILLKLLLEKEKKKKTFRKFRDSEHHITVIPSSTVLFLFFVDISHDQTDNVFGTSCCRKKSHDPSKRVA